MPIPPTFTLRDQPTPSQTGSATEQSSASSHHGDIIAGSIIGIAGLLMIAVWIKTTGIPWYKRCRELKTMKNKAIADREAVLGFSTRESLHQSQLPPILEVQSSSSLGQQLEIVPHKVQSPQGLSTNSPPRTSSGTSDQITSTELTEPELEPFPAFDPHYRRSGEFTDIPTSIFRNSQTTVGTFSTTFSIGDAVPMSMAVVTPAKISIACNTHEPAQNSTFVVGSDDEHEV